MSKRTFLGAGAIAFAALQLIRPSIPHPPVTADLAAPDEVKRILRTACYDCHSNETRLVWFDQIVPAYWLVASDVKDGRRHLNFSEIGRLSPAQQKATLYEAVNQIQLGAMPLPAYRRLHRDAVLSADQLKILRDYLNPPAAETAASASDLAADDAQYAEWVRGGSPARVVTPAPNGIEFLPDYKNWKAMSTTDRFDNGTMRAILGNGAAIQAIADSRTNPWPDGTAFAKVAWLARDNGRGEVRPGAFYQVEFMIRDSRKYAATKGWGWARWRGAGLTPYGKDAHFSDECVGCHTPVRNSDYVYTMPLREQAAVVGSLPRNPLQGQVIASAIDKRNGTMSTLYGNDVAAQFARSGGKQDYPAGSVLSLVTWTQREDPRWFGARIPGEVKSVEFVTFTPALSYESYGGSPLIRTFASDGRTSYLLSLRAAVMP